MSVSPLTPVTVPRATRPTNGLAVAALVLGIAGFLITPIPFFVGVFLGSPLNVLAIVFGIAGIARAKRARVGMALAVVGLVLGLLAFFSVFIGAGWLW